MMFSERDRVRKEAIMEINLNSKTIPYVVKKTVDISTQVRKAVFKKLMTSDLKFEQISSEDKMELVVNSLKDHESDIVVLAREYFS